MHYRLTFSLVFQIASDLGQAEHAHGYHHEPDPVGELLNPEGKSLYSGIDIRTDQSQKQSQDDHAQRQLRATAVKKRFWGPLHLGEPRRVSFFCSRIVMWEAQYHKISNSCQLTRSNLI